MRIHFYAENYKGIRVKSINFEDQLIVFSSPNGGGKSSIIEGMGICLGLTKDAFKVNSLRELIRNGTNQCSLLLEISEGPKQPTKRFEVTIFRTKEHNNFDMYCEEDEMGESQENEDELADDKRLLVNYFVDGKRVTYGKYLTEVKSFGTNDFSTALSVVNHQLINRSPDDDSKLYQYLVAMSGVDRWEKSSEYRTYQTSKKQADAKIMFLGKQKKDLKKERTLTRWVYYLRLFKFDGEIEEQQAKLEKLAKAGKTSKNTRDQLISLKQRRLKYLQLMKTNNMKLKLKKGSLDDLEYRNPNESSRSYTNADIKKGDALVIDFMPLKTHFTEKLTKDFVEAKTRSLSSEVEEIAVEVTYKNENPTMVIEKEQALKNSLKQFEKIRAKIERKFEEEEKKKMNKFKQFVANVNGRFNMFFQKYYDSRDATAEIRLVDEPHIAELHITDSHGTEGTITGRSAGEKRVAQLVLSFAILGEKNVPFAFVDNADISFFKENGKRMLDFCKEVLKKSETMKNIVLVGNDPHNFFHGCMKDGVKIMNI